MDVTGEVRQVGIAVYVLGFEWSLVEWPDALLLAIDGFDIGGAEGLHDFVTDILTL